MKRNFLTILLLAIAIIANADNRAMTLKNLIGGSNINGDYIDLNANTMLVDQCHGGEMLLLYQQRNSEAMLYSSVEQSTVGRRTTRRYLPGHPHGSAELQQYRP